ncbi:MAG: hypothetical protein U1F98_10080 [Verrucomicrobiota bacterium]
MSSRRVQWLAFAGAALMATAAARAQVGPQGGEYSIAGALPGDQVHPAASLQSGGGWLVWQDNSITPIGSRILATRLNPALQQAQPGSNIVVSAAWKSKATLDQENPDVAALPDGSAIVVWQGGKVGAQRIYLRAISSTGKPLGGDFPVSAKSKFSQSNPKIATLPDGNVIVVWQSSDQDGSMLGVFARRFSPAGKAIGSEFQVNQFTQNNQRSPAVAARSSGFVVTWISELQRTPAGVDVYARLFDTTGTALTPEIVVNSTTNVICANPSVACNADGSFAVAWSQYNATVSTAWTSGDSPDNYTLSRSDFHQSSVNGWDVHGRVFNASGAPLKDDPDFVLNRYLLGDQFGPRISAAGTNYFVVWTSLSQPVSSGSSTLDPWEGVFGQVLAADGTPASDSDLHINTTIVSRQIQPAVASDGLRFLVVWTSFTAGTSFDLRAQVYR